MARIFITGSADGLGQHAALELVKIGHEVVLHARSEERAQQALDAVTGAKDVLVGDLSSIDETKALALKGNALGTFDAVIHNAGVYRESENKVNADGLPLVFVINVLAPYILTCLMQTPKRLVYMSSGMHLQGDGSLRNLPNTKNDRGKEINYSDSKLHDVFLAFAIARHWPHVYSNAVNPGWVPTRMGGPGAPDSFENGIATQVWLATSNDREALVSGRYFHNKKESHHLPAADNPELQDEFVSRCREITGVSIP